MSTIATERKNIVTFKGTPVTITGNEIKVGDQAPDTTLVSNGLEAVSISSFKGKTCIIVAVPSLDTPVCDLEAKRFNTEAAKLGNNTVVLLVSRDLPFAQARWCGANKAENIQSLSDYNSREFGNAWGINWKEANLLTRAVFIVDTEGVIRYIQIVPEITTEPNYEDVLENLKKITS